MVSAVSPKIAKTAKTINIQRYHLYWANLDPTKGSEINKTRPVLVVSPDAMNKRLDTVVICPLTSQLHPTWASRVACNCAGKPSEVAIDQIRTVSKSRLLQLIGNTDTHTAQQVREVIALLYATN